LPEPIAPAHEADRRDAMLVEERAVLDHEAFVRF